MNRIRQCSFALLVVSVLFALLPLLTYGQGSIEVISNKHTNEFPNQIKFALEASSASEITKITLYYKLKGSSILTYAYPKFQRGRRIQTEYVWNTQTKYVPPGAELQYYWTIEDASGNKLKTQQSSFTIEDTRFRWQKQGNDKVTLYWYQGDASFAANILQFANKALDELSREVGIQLQEPVKIYIYASTKDLLGALEPKAQEWTGGRSFSELGIIALTVEPSTSGISWAQRAVPHELSHVVIHQATRNPYGDIPQWLDEGLAMHAEGELDASYQRVLEAAIKNNRLISLKSLASNFPADPEQARLSYAESHSVVEFILKRYGREKMAALLAVFKEGSTYDDALMAALGVDVDSLETEWRASLGLEPIGTPTPIALVSQDAGDGGSSSEAEPESSKGICGGIWQIVGLAGAALALRFRFARP